MKLRAFPYNLDYVLGEAEKLPPEYAPCLPHRYNLGLGISNSCNFDCAICYYHAPAGRDKPCIMSASLLERILAALPRLAGIIFGLEGEPLLHPQFSRLLELAACHSDSVTLITNGSLVSKSTAKALAGTGNCRVFLSIDASDAKLYENLRSGGKFRDFIRNAALLAKSATCVLHATVFRDNLESLARLPVLAATLGIGHVSFQQLRAHPRSILKGINPASCEELEAWLPEMLEQASKYMVQAILERHFGGPGLHKTIQQLKLAHANLYMPECQPNVCAHASSFAGILADGSFFPCAGDFTPVTLPVYTFDSIFNHPYLLYLRALHKAGKTTRACRICMNVESDQGRLPFLAATALPAPTLPASFIKWHFPS